MTFSKAMALCWNVIRANKAVKQEELVKMTTMVVINHVGREEEQVVNKNKKRMGMGKREKRRWKT